MRKLCAGLAPSLLALVCVAALLPGLNVRAAAAVVVTVTPASGVVGTIVNVTAVGLTPNDPFRIDMGAYSGVVSGNVSPGGAVNATFTVGNLPRGTYVIDLNTTSGDTTAAPKPTFTVGGSLAINQVQGPAGSSFTVTGYGFTANTHYRVLFNGNPIDESTTDITDAQGHFSKVVSTAGLPRASYAVSAATTFTGDSAYAGTFTVLPVLSVSPLTGVCGNPVQVSGAGFAAGQTVYIYYDSNEVATVTASTTGAFSSLPVVIPVSRAGAHVFTAKDNAVTAGAINFTVIPRLTADPVSGGAGDTVSLQGSGFNISAAVSLYWDETLISSSLTTDASGSFALSDFTVPASAGGSHIFKATDNAGNSASFSFSIGARLSLSPATGGPGTAVTVTGSSFQAGETITLSFNGKAVTSNPATITATSLGGFSAVITVPTGPAGAREVTASDGTNSASADFTTTSSISVSPLTSDTTPAYSGDSLTVSGAAFVPQSIVSLQVEGLAGNLASPTAGSDGSFTASFTVPALTGGLHRVLATSNGGTVSANFIVGARIESVPASAAPGATVDVSGTGFSAGKTITLKLGGQPLTLSPASVTVDQSGSFTASFVMPGLAAGTRQLTASDTLSQASLDFNTTADVTPAQGGSTAHPGYVGMQVPLSGAGFSPNSQVTITYDNPAVTLGSATTDSNGAFSTTVTIPVSLKGNHVITVRDNAATPVMKQFTFVISATAPPAPQLTLPEIGVKQGSHPTFTWQDVATGDAAHTMNLPVTYTLQISLNNSFSSLTLEKTGLTTPSYTLGEAEGLESTSGEIPYYWRVRATDSAGNQSNWSAAQPFSVGFIFAFEGWVVWLCLGLCIVVAFGVGLFLGQGPLRLQLYELRNKLKFKR